MAPGEQQRKLVDRGQEAVEVGSGLSGGSGGAAFHDAGATAASLCYMGPGGAWAFGPRRQPLRWLGDASSSQAQSLKYYQENGAKWSQACDFLQYFWLYARTCRQSA